MSVKMTRCFIEGHYYKIDLGQAPDGIGVKYHVKCDRCGYRILINDKCYEGRKSGAYKL